MREFLMGLYLEHGERAFIRPELSSLFPYKQSVIEGYIKYNYLSLTPFQLTTKAIEFLKNDS